MIVAVIIAGRADRTGGQRLIGGGMHRRMNQLTRRRWLLSPVISWQAWRLSRKTGTTFDAAWVKLRTANYPEELVYARRLPGEQDGAGR